MVQEAIVRGTAAFSPCGQYRRWLKRLWQPAAPRLIFIGLNPSRADGQRDDPTLRRLVGFAQRWGYGSLEVLNLFARISPSPPVLRRDQGVLALVQGRGPWALGFTAAGQPRHPLYVASDVALQSLTWHNQQTLGHPVGTSVSLPGAPPCPASPAAMPCICI